jgi:RNA polymerase sigma factor (sigma-70 family)
LWGRLNRLLVQAVFAMMHAVPLPDLKALRCGDPTAWDEAFHWLWPAAFAVAQIKLQSLLPEDVEDVAIEALEQLVDHVGQVKTVEELKPLAASIAHNRAVSRLRERFAAKRGAGRTESLEAMQDAEGHPQEPTQPDGVLAAMEQMELARLLQEVQQDLKPDHRAIVSDFFVAGLSYEQIAAKRSVAVGSVGVYLKRGLETMRRCGARHPQLLKELEAFLR